MIYTSFRAFSFGRQMSGERATHQSQSIDFHTFYQHFSFCI